jgi:glycosyltransferase involved in cell wall biosynthesis
MRIAFLTPEYVTEAKFDGGLANYIYRVVRLLREAGHEPEVFVAASIDETIRHEGCLVHRCAPSKVLTRLHRVQRRLARRPWFSYMDVMITAKSLARAFAIQHKARPYDLVEASNFRATGLFLRGPSRPALVTRISYRADLLDRASGSKGSIDRWLRCWLEDLSTRRSDGVYGPCTRIADVVARHLHKPVSVIHPPVFRSVDAEHEDESIWAERLKGHRYVLFFGRICKVKGADVLARAMQPILESDPLLNLAMVGRPETDADLEDIRRVIGACGDRFIHIERQPHSRLFPLIRNAELVALPSRVDNFPNACIEAMLQRQIVIGTTDTGFADLITHGFNGLLARPDDEGDLRKVISHALNLSPDESQRMRDAALSTVLAMDPRGAIEKLLAFYSSHLPRPNFRGTS